MGRDDIRLQILRKIHHQHRAFDSRLIRFRRRKLHSEIGAQRGKNQAVISDKLQKINPILFRQVFRRQLTAGDIRLQPLHAELLCIADSGFEIDRKGIRDHPNFHHNVLPP